MKEYRQNAHVGTLVFWAILCAATAIVLFLHTPYLREESRQVLEVVGGIALLIFGPVALAVYLIRSELAWVSVDAERGIFVGKKRLIPWEAVVRVERRRPNSPGAENWGC